MARLASHVWVGAFLRLEAFHNAVVLHRGSAEAGAILVVVARPGASPGRETFEAFAPAPQAVFAAGEDERRFELALGEADAMQLADWIERQRRFDPDCWVVETTRASGLPDLLGPVVTGRPDQPPIA